MVEKSRNFVPAGAVRLANNRFRAPPQRASEGRFADKGSHCLLIRFRELAMTDQAALCLELVLKIDFPLNH